MPEPTLLAIILVFGVTIFASFAAGFSGFGATLLIMAGLSWYVPEPERLSAVCMLVGVVIMGSIFFISRLESPIDWRSVGLLYAGLLPSLPIGYQVIQKYGASPVFLVILGIVLICFAVNGLVRPRFPRVHFFWAVPLGFLSGFLSGAFISGGPPMVLYLYSREQDPRRAVVSLQTIFLMAMATRILVTESIGPGLSPEIWLWFLGVLPVVLVSTLIGRYCARRVSAESFTQAVYMLIGIGGAVNIMKGLLSMAAS